VTVLGGERVGIHPGDAPDRAAAVTRAWLAEHLPAGWGRASAGGSPPYRAGAPDEAAYRAWYPGFAGSGLATPGWPAEDFGLGLGPTQCQAVNRELRAAGIVRLGALDLHRAGPTILQWGSPEQRARFLPGVVAGTEPWTQLFSEPGAGSDLPSLSTRAVRDGDEWVVTGQKVWSSYAGWATFGMLLARTDPHTPKRQGITYFVIEMDQPGIEARPLVQMTGDAEFFEVFLEEARVPDANRLGPVGRGWDVARTTLAGERRFGGDGSSPGTARSIGRLIDGQRDASGRVSGPVTRQRLAALSVRRTVNVWTVQRLEQRRDAGTLRSSAGKLGTSAYATELRTTWLDLAGAHGTGCDDGDRSQLCTRHDFLAHPSERIAGGSDEIQRNTLGESVLGLPREPDPYHARPWSEIPRS
jgi:alkylation response protein AidB-like acyl-CoA dehydrogenase